MSIVSDSEPRRPEEIRGKSQIALAPRAAEQETVGPGLWQALKRAASQWVEHKDAKAGAALAYYSIFSIGPLIIVMISVAALVFGREGVQAQVTETLRGLLGDQGAEAINGMLTSAGKPSEGVFAAIIGTGTLIFAAIGAVVQLKEALNSVWEVKSTPGTGIWHFARTYVFSLAGVLALGFLLLTSLLLSAGLAAFGKYGGGVLPEVILQAAGFFVSFAVISLLFALMFKWLPDTQVEWRDVWLGAVGTAALFEIGKFLIALYIGKQGLESTYGAAASIVVVLIWIYYSAQIVLLGAEFTNVRAKQRAKDPHPAREASLADRGALAGTNREFGRILETRTDVSLHVSHPALAGAVILLVGLYILRLRKT